MKAIISRTAAVAAMLVCLGNVQAEDLNFSELESRLAKIESQLAGQDGMQQASYCCDNGCCDGGCCDSGCCDSSCCCEASCGCDNGCCGGCCDSCGCGDCCGSCGGGGSYYAAVELYWARFHANSSLAPGKLSEKHDLSPRFIVGYENCNGQGARIRYWTYDETVYLETGAPVFDVEFSVLDLEATNRFQFCRTDVTLAAGFRAVGIDITVGGATVSADLIGLTMAADVEYLVCCNCCSYWSGLYGGRMSILGGNWDNGNALVPAEQDDNVVVTELYGGVEYGRCQGGYDIYTQFKFEIQNWHSDTIGDNTATDSIGFVGPSWTVGVGF